MNKESTPSKTKTITYYKPTPVLTSYPPQYKHPDGTIKLYPPEPEVDFQIKVPVDEQESEKILKASISLAELLFEGLTIGDFGGIAREYGEIVEKAIRQKVQIDSDIVEKHLNKLRKEFCDGYL